MHSLAKRLFVAIVPTISLLSGCVFPTPPPSMSHAKFARSPAQTTRVGFSTGAAARVEEDENGYTFLSFPVEGGLAHSLSDDYDVAFSTPGTIGNAEGNFAVTTEPVRLGLLHGVGLGFLGTEEDLETFLQASGGLMIETEPVFGAAKYTYSHVEGGDDSSFEPTHYVTGNVGYMPTHDGAFRIAPELVLNWSSFETGTADGGTKTTSAITVFAGVTFMAGD